MLVAPLLNHFLTHPEANTASMPFGRTQSRKSRCSTEGIKLATYKSGSKARAAFQDKLKRRPHYCLWLSPTLRISAGLRSLNLRSPNDRGSYA
ncbi:hypothetical protein [Chroococcidiopsis thermalis]|uniref:hypothetical protein n=1 Tax=Chroococcidiopsis thermalis TaxID=54299 RepID=UPI0015F1143A|nr:hypothetical protein [Chroococcidiopsis thermalis]